MFLSNIIRTGYFVECNVMHTSPAKQFTFGVNRSVEVNRFGINTEFCLPGSIFGVKF